MLDADADAIRCAQRTARLAECSNVDVRASDVCRAVAERTFDVVVSNPPFHLGKGTDLAIPRAFIEQAHARLHRGGRLYLVANRTLPYERLIAEVFGEVRTAHDGRRFKVIGGVRRA
jgi:16S rRNA (guanine1207-N2)-methyltransferase